MSARARTPRRRAAVVAAGAVAVAAAAGTGAVALASGGGERAAAGPALPPATAEVTRADLVDSQAVDGTLGYGEADTLANRLAGTVTWTAAEGAVVNRGGTLYSLDGKPVTLMYGNLPLYRRLAEDVADGADVRQLERNLRELGYTGFTVDEEFTDATADAVREWQEDRGLAETGTVDVGQVIFASGAVRVAETKLNVGDPAGPGAPALEVTGTTRKVTVPMPVEDVRLARKNAKVTVELPGGERVSGTVTHVGTVAQQADDAEGEDPGGDGGDATIEVIVTLAAGRARGGIDQAPVSVEFVSEQRKGVLTVPVAALLALREGGYGLQVVTGGTSRLVAVETGMFADGRVEVSGTGITAGTKVGVPAS